MPIKVDNALPAKKILQNENIFVINKDRALSQDIRPLEIAILNLMPLKEQTEAQLLRMLSNSPLQIEITLISTATHQSKNTPSDHLNKFYRTFSEIKDNKYDGMIITGAPVELLPFEQVDYWDEVCEIMEWTKSHVTSTFHICWGAQAGLYYHYGVDKFNLNKKMFGIFEHEVVEKKCPLVRGFDDLFLAPHSRHTAVKNTDILDHKDLKLLSASKEAGVYIAMSKDEKQIFVTGHSEYDADTIKNEYLRDVNKGLKINKPVNYFNGDESLEPPATWRSHAHLLYANWLNYYVYQMTPYLIDEVGEKR